MTLGRNRLVWLFVAASCLVASTLLSRANDAPPSDDWKAPPRAARKTNPIPADDNSIATGKNVYAHQCRSCHGDTGHGDGPRADDLSPSPHDLADPLVVRQSDGALFWKITEGRRPMPSFEKLTSEEQRWHVVNYIRTLAPPSSKPSD